VWEEKPVLEKTTETIEGLCSVTAGCGSEGVIARATALVRSPSWQQFMGQFCDDGALWIRGLFDEGAASSSRAASVSSAESWWCIISQCGFCAGVVVAMISCRLEQKRRLQRVQPANLRRLRGADSVRGFLRRPDP